VVHTMVLPCCEACEVCDCSALDRCSPTCVVDNVGICRRHHDSCRCTATAAPSRNLAIAPPMPVLRQLAMCQRRSGRALDMYQLELDLVDPPGTLPW